MKIEKLSLRLFSRDDGELISQWIIDPAYKKFYRYMQVMPSKEECSEYPKWSNNLVMMVDAEIEDDNDNQYKYTIGKVIAYQCHYKSGICYVGVLIDKTLHGLGVGHNVTAIWVDYLFKVLGFRKVFVQHLAQDERLNKGYQEAGFSEPILLKEQCYLDGELQDEYLLSCLSKDWKGRVK